MLSVIDIMALIWFSLLWGGYTLYAKRRAKVVSCLSFEMRRKRNHWMQQMLRRALPMTQSPAWTGAPGRR